MIRFIVAWAFLSVGLVGQAIAAGAARDNGYYQGTLDHRGVILALGAGYGEMAGRYRYLQFGPPIWLRNDSKSGGDLVLTELSGASGKSVAQFRGTLDDDQNFHGRWVSNDGKKSLAVELERIAEVADYSVHEPRFSVERSVPQFVSDTPFHAAINARLSKRAKDELDDTAADYRKSTADAVAGDIPWESTVTVEILHADETIVSLLYQTAEFSGGVHYNYSYESVTYLWREGHVVEIKPSDLVLKDSIDHVTGSIIKALEHQKAGWPEDVKTIKFDELVVNPTADGLLFTFAPYEVDSFAGGVHYVMLPYSSLKDSVPAGSPLRALMNANRGERASAD